MKDLPNISRDQLGRYMVLVKICKEFLRDKKQEELPDELYE